VLLLDHAPVIGEKIRISGGGRCNFTNLHSTPENFLCLMPDFPKTALRGYTPHDFIRLVRTHRIGFHEKHRGQLFCDRSSLDIIGMLRTEAERGGVRLAHPIRVLGIGRTGNHWSIQTDQGAIDAPQLVMATGGLPVPAIGATGLSLDTARHLGLSVTPIQPALVPLALTDQEAGFLTALAGVSLPVGISAGGAGGALDTGGYGAACFDEDLLITHKGISGPAVLQASSYWQPGEEISIDFLPGDDPLQAFDERRYGGKTVASMLAERLPDRLAQALTARAGLSQGRWAEQGRRQRQALFGLLKTFRVKPAGSLGWKKAEVMRGGVSTRDIDPGTFEARAHAGLFFIGECVDVTGHLGGHNFQWAWASGYACAQALRPR
jgi:predicted Rossmann fold flavoprotein